MTDHPVGLDRLLDDLPDEDDRPTGQKYPSQITVYCDRYGCEVERTGDYIVTDTMTRDERLAVARKHLVENEGWGHTTDGDDFCPEHARPQAVTEA